MTATKAMGPIGLMTSKDYVRGNSEVDQALALRNENRLKEQRVQNGIHDLVGEVGKIQLSVSQQQKQESETRINVANKNIQSANAERDHDLLVNALAKMIFEAVKQTPAPAQNPTQKPAERAKQIAESVIKIFESKNIPNYAVFAETNKCMTLTPGVASTILELLKVVPNCVAPDLSKFQNKILPEALRSVLANKQITKIIFAASAKGTAVEQVALEVKRTRQLEVAFV